MLHAHVEDGQLACFPISIEKKDALLTDQGLSGGSSEADPPFFAGFPIKL
jgi:hypothetical protein